MRPQISGIFITEKDIHFFNYLYAVKVATYSQINRDIYTGYTRKSVANRIRKMEDNHLLEGYQKRNIANGQRFISLTKKGFDGFVKRGYEKRVEPKSGSVTHDLFLVDIRHKLMKQNRVKGYTTENELQTWGHPLGDASYLDFVYLRPDAVTGLQYPTCIIQIPVEYDAFHKSRNRYVNVVKQYYDSAVVPILLFICREKRSMKQLKKIEERAMISSRPKFFYALKSDFVKPIHRVSTILEATG